MQAKAIRVQQWRVAKLAIIAVCGCRAAGESRSLLRDQEPNACLQTNFEAGISQQLFAPY